jgi:predicted SPOUT superfamily RNA methylase MTH1
LKHAGLLPKTSIPHFGQFQSGRFTDGVGAALFAVAVRLLRVAPHLTHAGLLPKMRMLQFGQFQSHA